MKKTSVSDLLHEGIHQAYLIFSTRRKYCQRLDAIAVGQGRIRKAILNALFEEFVPLRLSACRDGLGTTDNALI
jgi:hypothetical protein